MRDWVAWHEGYDEPSSVISRRLALIRPHVADAIAQARPGMVRVVSLCAGQGHDVIGALTGHPRRADVRAVLVELDPRNAELARRRAAAAGLPHVQVREADASRVSSFADALPADVLLLCGIFGNVSDADIRRVVDATPALCAAGATVIWTRHRRPPDLTPSIRAWFAGHGFDEVAFHALDNERMSAVGVHQLRGRPAGAAELPGEPLFAFRAEDP